MIDGSERATPGGGIRMRKATGLLLAGKSFYSFSRLRVKARMLTGLPKAESNQDNPVLF